AIVGDERVVVHERPGTTRDPVDLLIEVDGREIVLIDTAGLRRRGKTAEAVERDSQRRAIAAARRADVAIVVCDAMEGLTDSDLAAADQPPPPDCPTPPAMT